jgi:hypothetical protein
MDITYPPELLPKADPDAEVEIVISGPIDKADLLTLVGRNDCLALAPSGEGARLLLKPAGLREAVDM